MAINLVKGQKINLEKSAGSKLTNFCVGCNWGALLGKKKGWFGFGKQERYDVDLDLSCILLDEKGNIVDHIYSPEYRQDFLAHYGMPPGKLASVEGALQHSGDDRKGDQEEDDDLDNEIISVNLDRVKPEIQQIFFFLNNVGPEDFSKIPYVSIRMFEGTPQKVNEIFARYDVAASPEYAGKRALIMGKLYRRGSDWKFGAIGDAFDDANICETINRIAKQYAK